MRLLTFFGDGLPEAPPAAADVAALPTTGSGTGGLWNNNIQPGPGVSALSPADPHDGTVSMFVPFGVLLGCMALAVVIVVAWWVDRVQKRQQLRQQAAAAAAAAEDTAGCGAGGQCDEPYIPKIPVIIVLPDNSTHFGWQLDHTPCGSPTATAAAAAAAAAAGFGGGEEVEGGEVKQAASTPRRMHAAPAAAAGGEGSQSGGGVQAAAGEQLAEEQRQASGRRRPPLYSIEMQAPLPYPDTRQQESRGSGI